MPRAASRNCNLGRRVKTVRRCRKSATVNPVFTIRLQLFDDQLEPGPPHETRFVDRTAAALALLAGRLSPNSSNSRRAIHIKLNRIYKVDKLTGEITACQYGAAEGSVGVTLCYPAGDGATAQAPGDYGSLPPIMSMTAGFSVSTAAMAMCRSAMSQRGKGRMHPAIVRQDGRDGQHRPAEAGS